jgi:CheY-like chemotaxis protein
MDINMPEIDGVRATKKLKDMHAEGRINLTNTKIYMHSAIQYSIDWEDTFDGRLNKPINFNSLK